MALHVDIVTPAGLVVEDERTDALTAPSIMGEVGILEKHTPLIAVLQPGVVRYEADGATRVYAVHEGVLELDHDWARILVQDCVPGADVDVEQQRERVAETEQKMKDLDTESDEYRFLESARDFARAQLQAAAEHEGRPRV